MHMQVLPVCVGGSSFEIFLFSGLLGAMDGLETGEVLLLPGATRVYSNSLAFWKQHI